MVQPPPGVFHHANPPIHTHPSCGFCKKASRCIDQDRDQSLKLSRCTGCNITQYCSTECQSKHRKRHEWECEGWQATRKHAVVASRNAHAWADFTHWLDFHQDSLKNAALAHLIWLGSGSELRSIPFVSVTYVNHHKLPAERKFRYTRNGAKDLYLPWRFAIASVLFVSAWMNRWVPLLGKLFPERIGTYIVEVNFGDKKMMPVHFDLQLSNAHLAAKVIPKLQQKAPTLLNQAFSQGQRQRFCCGHIPGLSTCCCGGWPHEEQNEEREMTSTAGKRATRRVISTLKIAKILIYFIVNLCTKLLVYMMKLFTKRAEATVEDPLKEHAFTKPNRTKKKKKIEPKERSSPNPDPSPPDHKDDREPSSVTAKRDKPVAGSTFDAIPAATTRQAASRQVAANDAVDTGTPSETNHSPEPRFGESYNARLDIGPEPVVSSRTDIDTMPATDHGDAHFVPLSQGSNGHTERPDALQSRKQKKSKKGRRPVQLDSVGSGRSHEPRADPPAVTSTTCEELPENVAVSHPVEAPETSSLSASCYAVSGPAIPESPASPATDTSEVQLDSDGHISGVRNDALSAEVEGEASQWVPVKSKREMQQTRRTAPELPKTAVTTSIHSHNERVGTQIDEVPVVRPMPDRTLLEAEIDRPPRTSPIYLPPVILSDTAPRSDAELKPTPVPPRSSAAASTPGKRPWRRRTASSQKISTAKSGARGGKSLKSSAPPGLQHPSSTLSGLHLDNGASPLTSNPASVLDEVRAITAMRKPPASLPANPTPSRNRKHRSTSPEPVIPLAVPQQPAYADKDVHHTVERQWISTEQLNPEATGEAQEPIALASVHEAIPSDILTALESTHSSHHSPSIAEEPCESSHAPIQPGGRGTSLIPDAPPGLKHPGYTFGSLHFGGEVSQPSVRDHAASDQPPASASTTMESEQVLPKPEADYGYPPEQSYDDAQGSASDSQQQLPEPTWPSIQQSAAVDQSCEAEYSGIHQQYTPQQQQFYQPLHDYQQQQQYQGHTAYPPPGLVPPHSPWPYYTTYGTQADAGPYVYSAPYGLYAGPYGTMPDPYAQSMHVQQPASAPVLPADQDAAQTLKTATEALKAAVRVLEGTSESQDHSGVMEQAYAVLNEAQEKYGDR